MSALTNPKHERFAQELAKGKSADEAYVIAGYKQNRGNASTLKQDQSILDRIAFLLSERELIHAQATADAVKATGLTKEWVIETLKENVARAMQATPVKTDDDGAAIGEYQYQGSVANRALELLGKELGMFVERTEDVTRRNLEQIDARIHQLLGERDEAGVVEPSGGAGSGATGKPH